MAETQHTLKDNARISGIALHTGVRAHLTLRPGPVDSGVVLRRVDLAHGPTGPALATNVLDVKRATTIACGDACVHTVEHVLAALHALGVDNALVEMDGPEPPIGDGSSAPYVDLVREAGIVPQDKPRRYLAITSPCWFEQGDTRLVALPTEADEFRISCTIKFGHCQMDCQYLSLPVNAESFVNDLCGARTFCAYHEIAELMLAGLIRGGSLDNAVVIKDGAIISKDGLRYEDEFVRHKMLDMVGDLSLVGRRIHGHILAVKPGHPANVALAQRIVNTFEKKEKP